MIGSENLYGLGLTSVLLSSKYEDVKPIRMKILLDKAGHNKFSRDYILDLERDILQTISFRVQGPPTVYHQANLIFKQSSHSKASTEEA